MTESTNTATPVRKRRLSLIMVLSVLLIAAVGASVFFYFKYTDASKNAKADQQKVLQTIATVLQLPGGDPSSFTIADKSRLTNQMLASRVENGDTLFVYDAAKKVIVYRPSTKKVIDILSVESPKTTIETTR